jgi:putative membrane protein
MLVGCLIFLIAIYLFVKTISAPMKRNMDIDGRELLSLFVTHMNEGSHELEKLFYKSGAYIDTVVSIVSFKAKDKIKALFISPAVHPGPLGNIGGSNMPTNLANRFKPFTMVAHGPSTHDFNPASIDELDKIEDSIRRGLYKIKYSNKASKFIRYTNKSAKIGVQSFDEGIILLNTFAPLGSDDIEFSVGLTMMVKANKKFENKSTVIVDCHNSFSKESGQVLPGDPQVFELIDGIDKIELGEKYSGIKVGCSQNLMEGLGKQEGIGDSGVKTMIVEVASQKTAYILFDSNNMEVGFRQEILDSVYKLGIDEAEVMTTDTHNVNTISRGYNPIGLSNRERIIEYVKETIEEALDDLEEVEVGCATEKVEHLRTFGPNKSTELISTISSIVQVAKYIAPINFILAFLFTIIWLFVL